MSDSLEDWEKDDVVIEPKKTQEFEGGWDDLEQEQVVVPTTQPKVSEGKVVAVVTKTKKKQLLKESIERKEAEMAKAAQLTPDQMRKQKEEDEKRRKDSDFDHAIALFEGGPKRNVSTATGVPALKSETEAGFVDLAKQFNDLVSPHSDSEHYLAFLKESVKLFTASSDVSVEDVKATIATLTTVMNAKIKSEKAKSGKKTQPKKATKGGDWSKVSAMEDTLGGGGEGYNEYDDFM